jgi:glutamate-1-semialdehyde 2,1-aminomutase
LGDTRIVPFNDLDAVERVPKKRRDEIAATIMEPLLGTAGMVLPRTGYLKGIRELEDRYGALLILMRF